MKIHIKKDSFFDKSKEEVMETYGLTKTQYKYIREKGIQKDSNGKTLEEYLPLETLRMLVKSPLVLCEVEGQFDIKINVNGGGYTGQSGAMRHAITRALMEASADYRPKLKAAGFVTRDSRVKERKKYGLKGARRAPQFSKR